MKKIYVILLTLICLMGFGLSFNKVEAAEEVYREAKFGAAYNSKSVSSYAASFSATNAGFTVNVVNANNNTNKWDYIKFGHNSTAYVGTVTTASAIDKAVSKVEINIGAVTASAINSVKLYVSSDATFDASDTAYAVKFAIGVQSVAIETPTANSYYKLEVDCKASSNGTFQLDGIKYYADLAPVSKPALSQEEFNSTGIEAQLSFKYMERLSSNLELNVADMWAADSNIEHDTYVSSLSFGGITLTTPVAENGTFKDVIRHWISSGTKQLRLYGNDSITLSTSAPIKSVEFVGSASGMAISTTGYSFSNKTISLDAEETAVNSITFTVSSKFELTAINVVTTSQADASLPKYKDFTDVTISFKSSFDPVNYSNELYYSNGIIVSTSSTVATDYATELPTEGTVNGNRYVVSGTTGDTAKADFVLNLKMSDLTKCNDTLYVYSYVSGMDANANDFIYYTAAKEYSVSSLISTYLALTGDQALDTDTQELLKALQSAITAANTPAA